MLNQEDADDAYDDEKPSSGGGEHMFDHQVVMNTNSDCIGIADQDENHFTQSPYTSSKKVEKLPVKEDTSPSWLEFAAVEDSPDITQLEKQR